MMYRIQSSKNVNWIWQKLEKVMAKCKINRLSLMKIRREPKILNKNKDWKNPNKEEKQNAQVNTKK